MCRVKRMFRLRMSVFDCITMWCGLFTNQNWWGSCLIALCLPYSYLSPFWGQLPHPVTCYNSLIMATLCVIMKCTCQWSGQANTYPHTPVTQINCHCTWWCRWWWVCDSGMNAWGSSFTPAAIKRPGSGHSIYNAPNMPPLQNQAIVQKCSAGSKSHPLRDMVQIWQMFWWRLGWWPWLSSPGAKSYYCPCHGWTWALVTPMDHSCQ